MRKDSWFRGALLSALFFSLLLGNGAVLLATDSAGTCVDAGGHWDVRQGCLPMSEAPHCQAMQNIENAAETGIVVGGTVAAAGILEPSPLLELAGAALAGASGIAWLLNKAGQAIGGCS